MFSTEVEEYYQDLQLAAKLGTSLLERNQELQNEIMMLKLMNEEKDDEMKSVRHQLEQLKEECVNRAKVAESIDGQLIELERKWTTLVSENRAMRDKVKSLSETCVTLERERDTLTMQNHQLCRDVSGLQRQLERVHFQCESEASLSSSASSLPTAHPLSSPSSSSTSSSASASPSKRNRPNGNEDDDDDEDDNDANNNNAGANGVCSRMSDSSFNADDSTHGPSSDEESSSQIRAHQQAQTESPVSKHSDLFRQIFETLRHAQLVRDSAA